MRVKHNSWITTKTNRRWTLLTDQANTCTERLKSAADLRLVMDIQELVHPKEKPLKPHFLLKNTKGDVFKNVQTALLQEIRNEWKQKHHNKRVHMICILFSK